MQKNIVYNGQVVVPVLSSVDNKSGKVGYRDDVNSATSVEEKEHIGSQPMILHLNRPFGLDYIL